MRGCWPIFLRTSACVPDEAEGEHDPEYTIHQRPRDAALGAGWWVTRAEIVVVVCLPERCEEDNSAARQDDGFVMNENI